MIATAVMTDHPSWLSAGSTYYRAVRSGDAVWALIAEPSGTGCWQTSVNLVSGHGRQPVADVFDPASLTGTDGLIEPLRVAGTVARWRNPDIWDALATSIIRQVIRAGQARKLYREFSRVHGEMVSTPAGETWLFPTPTTVLELPEEEYSRLGLAFKWPPLQAAAQAYLNQRQVWADLDASTLLTAVQSVHRIGPWSAGATVADLTNDYSLYPFADLAVRTWAKRIAPERIWPDKEPEFAALWQQLSQDQLSEWTALTLAWGVQHVRSTGEAAF